MRRQVLKQPTPDHPLLTAMYAEVVDGTAVRIFGLVRPVFNAEPIVRIGDGLDIPRWMDKPPPPLPESDKKKKRKKK